MLSSNNILKPADGRPVTMPTQDMIIGLFHLTLARPRSRSARVGCSARSPRRSWPTTPASSTCGATVKLRLPGVVPHAGRRAAGGLGPQGDTLLVETTLGRALFNETLPVDYPFVERAGRQEAPLGDRQRPRRALPEGRRSPRRWTRSRRPASTGRTRSGTTVVHLRRRHAAAQAGDPRALRGQGRQGPGPVRARSDHRRRAPPGAHRDLDPGHQRGRQGDGGEPPADQLRLPDGQLRCSW